MNRPAFVDIDAEGDYDAFVGGGDGDPDLVLGSRDYVTYYTNTGTPESATFTYDPAAANVFTAASEPNKPDIGYFCPVLGDIDGDLDLDLYVGHEAGDISFYLNLPSTAGQALFREVGSQRSLDSTRVGLDAQLALGDLDGDGDLDALLAGSTARSATASSRLVLLENLNHAPVVRQRVYLPLQRNG